MTDRIDQEGRATFVQTLPRKVTELRATLGTLVADPRSQRMRDELRRRLHALYTLTRSYNLPTLSEGLREGIAHLDAVRGASVLSQRDLESLADLIATLPALAQRDLPDQPNLFQRPRSAESQRAMRAVRPPTPTQPAEPDAAGKLPPMPGPKAVPARLASRFPTHPGIPEPSARRATRPPPAAPAGTPTASTGSVPLGVLVAGGAGLAQEVKRALPPDADVQVVRTLAEAVTAARDTAPDVLVAETAPPADGLGLVAALRGDPLTDFLPVVLVASASEKLDVEQARAQGAAELLTQPLDPDRLREAIDRSAQGVATPSIPPPNFGELTLEELTKTLQEELRRGILAAAGPRANNAKIALGQGSEVLAATWEAIARVREVVEKRTHGKVRFELPGGGYGVANAHVLSIGAEEESTIPPDDGATDDPLPERRALVVDDDPGVVWFFAGLLRDAGMLVTECTDGADALRDARRIRPDVVISDILMPGIDGFALCRAIRRDVSLRHTPVILLSWKEDLLVRMREMGAQAQGFLRKESRGEAILARVRAVLRPRVRLLRRLETLGEGAELRGRVERVGVFSLLEATARALADATITVTDSFSVTELEVRKSSLVAASRTLQDGSLVRGESALLQVLGVSNARFSVRRAQHQVRPNVQGELHKLLEGGAALITALEDSLSGASLLEVASLDLDTEAAHSFARSLPEAMRGIVERIVGGESPRNLILRDGVAPQDLEPMLVELARRGAIRSVRGSDGQDLVGPRYAAAHANESLPIESGSPAARISSPPPAEKVPAAALVPSVSASAASPSAIDSTPDLSELTRLSEVTVSRKVSEAAKSAAAVGWTPPTNIDEASRPGFGLATDRDSLADAVLRELSEPGPEITETSSEEITPVQMDPEVKAGLEAAKKSAPATPEPEATKEEEVALPLTAATQTAPLLLSKEKITKAMQKQAAKSPPPAADDVPEIAESIDEEDLPSELLAKLAADPPTPQKENVRLDARGLPRRDSVPGLPKLGGPEFEPHEPAKVDHSPSGSIIVDERAVGAPVEVVVKPKTDSPSQRDTMPPPRIRHPYSEERSVFSTILWLAVGVLALGAASYLFVKFLLTRPAAASVTNTEATETESHPPTPAPVVEPERPTVTPTAPDAAAAATATNTAGAEVAPSMDAGVATAAASPNAVEPATFFEDPGHYLDGGVLQPGRGLLVLELPSRGGEVLIDQHPIDRGANLIQLAPGTHTVRYRYNAVVVFRFVPIRVGRASHVALSADQ